MLYDLAWATKTKGKIIWVKEANRKKQTKGRRKDRESRASIRKERWKRRFEKCDCIYPIVRRRRQRFDNKKWARMWLLRSQQRKDETVPCVRACPRLTTVEYGNEAKRKRTRGTEEMDEKRKRERWRERENEREKEREKEKESNACLADLRKHREPICPVCDMRALWSEPLPLPPQPP